MTSTNDGKDVKSNQISGPKSKTYFIELYKSLEARLSGECSGEERARHVCESWRRVHSLCQHSAPTTQVHLFNWLQQHTSRTILQTEWQSPKSKEHHKWLEAAIEDFLQQCQNAASRREGGWSPPWENQLRLRAIWFKSTLTNPWGHGVLKALLDSKGPQPSDEEVLEWLRLERAAMFVTRLRQLAASKCDDLALLLATAVMDRLRAAAVVVSDIEQVQGRDITEQTNKDFVKILQKEADFTDDVWNLITDIEFVLLFKGELRSRCIELAKQTSLHNGYQLVKRLHSRLELSPREKKLWKNAKDAATLVAQVVIARCMVVPQCAGAARVSLQECARSLVRLLPAARLPAAAAALAAPAATSAHLHTLADAVHAQCKEEQTPFVCELYVRAITAGMNELERLKIKTEKESEARSAEQTLSTWFSQLGMLLSASKRLYCECILTAFSVHPSADMYELVKTSPVLAPLQIDIQESNEPSNSEYGSWANDSRTQTNLVKTSETLNLKQTQKHSNVLSTAIFTEGEALGLGAELCQDLAVLISGPRVKTLSWDTDRDNLLDNCRVYMERTGGGTRALTTELRYLNLDPSCFQHLPEELDDDSDMYYGIEKGYEHLIEFKEEPEEIWREDVSDDAGKSDSETMDLPLAIQKKKKTRSKPLKYSSDEDLDPLSSNAIKVNVKKERPHSKERSKEGNEMIKVKQDTEDASAGSQDCEIQKGKARRGRKKKEKDLPSKVINKPNNSLSRFVGMKVAGLAALNKSRVLDANANTNVNTNVCITDSDYDSQGKSSIASLNSDGNDTDVLFDGLFSMEDIKSTEKNLNHHMQRVKNTNELNVNKAIMNAYNEYTPQYYRNPNPTPNVNMSNEDVKNGIKKLIEFRRAKYVNDVRIDTQTPLSSQSNLTPSVHIRSLLSPSNSIPPVHPRCLSSQSNSIPPVHPRCLSSQSNSIPPVHPRCISSQSNSIPPAHNYQNVASTNAPKDFHPKDQMKQLNALKDEVNNILQKTTFNRGTIAVNEAAEKFVTPNAGKNRPVDQFKNPSPNINHRQLEKVTKRNAQCKLTPYRNQNQELCKHFEGVNKPLMVKRMENPSQIQLLKASISSHMPRQVQKSESSSRMCQNIAQHISNTNSTLIHTKVENKDMLEQNLHHVKSDQSTSRTATHVQDPSNQRQFHYFLKDLQDSINAGASTDKQEIKLLPTQHSPKQMIQKKADNVPKTFARMSYLKNKQCEHKTKDSPEKILQYKFPPSKQIENLQYLQSKGDKTKPQLSMEKEKMSLENRDVKSKVKVEMIEHNMKSCTPLKTPLWIAENHPTVSNILSSGSQKSIPNIVTMNDLKCHEIMKPSNQEGSFLSQKDHDDVLNLLRQKSKLNSNKVQTRTLVPKSAATDSNTTLNYKTSVLVSGDAKARCSKSNNSIPNTPVSDVKNINEKLASSSVKISSLKVENFCQTKKGRKVKEPTKNPKNLTQNSDWESVMDAILATKTPTRVSQSGPNALDIALNKDSFERCYQNNTNAKNLSKDNSNTTIESIKNTPIVTSQKKIVTKINMPTVKSGKNPELKGNYKQCVISNKPQTSMKIATAPKPVQKPQQICCGTLLDLSKRDVIHAPVKPLPSVIQNRNDPFISGIKNSDYDLLEELMDDDLRQEIGELSDEELYNIALSNTNKYKNVSHTCDLSKKSNPVLNKNVYIQPQRNTDQFESTYKLTDLNYKDPASCNHKPVLQGNKCTPNTNNTESKLRIISNEIIVAPGNVNNSTDYFPVINKAASNNICRSATKTTNIALSNIIDSVVTSSTKKTVKIDDQSRNIKHNVQNCRFNVLDPTKVVLTVPQRNTTPNLMLIGNDYIYDPYSNIHIQDANVNANVSNYNQNKYTAVNQAPNSTVYHTQLTAPVVKPVLIGSSIVLPVSQNISNPVPKANVISSSIQRETKDNINTGTKSETEPKKLENNCSFDKKDINSKITEIVKTFPETPVHLTNSLKPQTYPLEKGSSSGNSPVNVNKSTGAIIHSDRQVLPFSQTKLRTDSTNSSISNENSILKKLTAVSVCEDDKIQTKSYENAEKTVFQKLHGESITMIETNNLSNKKLNKKCNRIHQKRSRILNRKIAHRCHDMPIPLAYEPIKHMKMSGTENFTAKNFPHKQSIASSKEKKVPKPTCRRILLRSSNSLSLVKAQNNETTESNLANLRKTRAEKRTKRKLKSSPVQLKLENHKSNTKTETSGVCAEKQENFKIKRQLEIKSLESKHKMTESNDCPIYEQTGENKLDSHMNFDLEEQIKPSIISVMKQKDPESKKDDGIEETSLEEYNKEEFKNNEVIKTEQTNLILDSTFEKAESKKTESTLNTNQISCDRNSHIQNTLDVNNINKNWQIEKELKDKMILEELPNLEGDLSKRYVRIKLPNGSFKATVSGKVNVNIESIFEDPDIKSMLREKMNSTTKCILNIKQVSLQSKHSLSVMKTHIHNVSYATTHELETIDLISDDDENVSPQSFKTEFGIFKIASMDTDLITKHQRRLSQRCEVKIQRDNKLNNIKVDEVRTEKDPNTISRKNTDLIQIDDSANESVVDLVNTVKCTAIKDNIVTCKVDQVIEDLKLNKRGKEREIEHEKSSDMCEAHAKNVLELKEVSLKIEKCDKLVKDYEHLKIKNRKCYVNLVRFDLEHCHGNNMKDNCSDLNTHYDSEDTKVSEDLNVDKEISSIICEQSLRRIDSMSILNDFTLSDSDLLTVSPSVIENFDMETDFIEKNGHVNLLNTNLMAVSCCADWLMTKSKNHDMRMKNLFNVSKLRSYEVENVNFTPDDISTDCDSDIESCAESDVTYFEEDKHTDIDSLVKIVLDLLSKHSYILESFKTAQVKCLNVSNPSRLKRKLDDFTDNTKCNKISKLEEITCGLENVIEKKREIQALNNKVLSLQNICCTYVNANVCSLLEENYVSLGDGKHKNIRNIRSLGQQQNKNCLMEQNKNYYLSNKSTIVESVHNITESTDDCKENFSCNNPCKESHILSNDVEIIGKVNHSSDVEYTIENIDKIETQKTYLSSSILVQTEGTDINNVINLDAGKDNNDGKDSSLHVQVLSRYQTSSCDNPFKLDEKVTDTTSVNDSIRNGEIINNQLGNSSTYELLGYGPKEDQNDIKLQIDMTNESHIAPHTPNNNSKLCLSPSSIYNNNSTQETNVKEECMKLHINNNSPLSADASNTLYNIMNSKNIKPLLNEKHQMKDNLIGDAVISDEINKNNILDKNASSSNISSVISKDFRTSEDGDKVINYDLKINQNIESSSYIQEKEENKRVNSVDNTLNKCYQIENPVEVDSQTIRVDTLGSSDPSPLVADERLEKVENENVSVLEKSSVMDKITKCTKTNSIINLHTSENNRYDIEDSKHILGIDEKTGNSEIFVKTLSEHNNSKSSSKELPSLTHENSNVLGKQPISESTKIISSENKKVEVNSSGVSAMKETDCVIEKSASSTLEEINTEHDRPKQKNVTLVYDSDSQVVLEGSIYEDPVVGTCYVFPIVGRTSMTVEKESLSNIADEKSKGVIESLKSKILEKKVKEESTVKDNSEECSNFNILPKKTYLKEKSQVNNINKNKKCLKRKIESTVIHSGKKYRKGKNIDYSKISMSAINDLAYSKEYKRLFDYYSSVTFSYSRPFHIEHIDVYKLLKSWPIRGSTIDSTEQTDFKNLLFADEDVYKKPFDPMNQTFAEEISYFTDEEYVSSNINENNFKMGFGERSDRVIKISEVGDDNSKFSAATLSDVKQAQPFLMSEDRDTNKKEIPESDSCKEQKNIFKRYLTYIKIKEKVRSFFQNTNLELYNRCLMGQKESCKNMYHRFPYGLTSPEFFRPSPSEYVVQVVQVGQLPVSAAAQNPVTCDPRVTQVTDASPSQCSEENSPQDDSQPPIKTEYTELTTADINFPMVQEYERHIEAHESLKASMNYENIPVETEIKIEIKDEIPDFDSDQNDCNENNDLQTLVNKHINNVEYPYDSSDNSEILNTPTNPDIMYEQEIQSDGNFIPEHENHNSSLEKSDQIAYAMNAAGIITNTEEICYSETVVDEQKLCPGGVDDDPQSPNNNSISLQQALSQILPQSLDQTAPEGDQSTTSSSLTSQVLHIDQGKNTDGNQITLVDNAQSSVINNSNTPMLHIDQNKASHTNSTSNTNSEQNNYGGLSLVDSGLQSGSNQLLHIVNTGTQKNNSTGQLLKRVNLVTNLSNNQGPNEQKMVQFVCKSADVKSIQLNAPHQRSMVLRLQPIEPNVQNNLKQSDNQESSPTSNGNNSTPVKGNGNPQAIKSRSVYEENYAKFIQSSNKGIFQKSTTLPKFNQAFGKPVFQEDNQKTLDIDSNNSHLTSLNSSADSPECQATDNAMNIDHIGQISSPPLLLRKSAAQTATSTQSNLVQQIKQTITPMNIQTMHGGVIYTRQIPVNIGGGQTINLITVPSTELLDTDNQKQGEVKFINQNDVESPIIKIVPQGQNNSNAESTGEEGSNPIGVSNENGQSAPTQHQPVLTQMRIKLPMLSKTPQMVSGTRVVRPSFFQIQRNVIGGANQPVYQQLVLTAAPPLSQHIRLPQTQTNRQVKVTSEGQSSSEPQMSTSTLEQLREFDMVLEQVKERSTGQPNPIPNNVFAKLQGSSSDSTDGSSVTSTVTESTQQVLYSIGNSQSVNVAYVNRKPNTTFVRSPDSSGIVDSPSSSTHIQIPRTVTSESSSNETPQPSQTKAAKVGSKSKSRPKSSGSMKINTVPPKTSNQKPLEDEQTTQRILYILAEYKEQVENSPDKDKPAPRRRTNPPSNPGSSKRKKSSCGSRRHGMCDMSPIHGEDTCRTMGSEDSSCGTSQGDCNETCMDCQSPQDSPRKVVRKLTFDNEATTPTQPRTIPQRNVILADGQTITVARGTSGKPTTAVLMPANYLLPVSMVKGGQQIAIVTNRGPKILTVGGEGGTTNALLLQRLIGPAGLKPVLARPGVRHVRLPTAALHNLHAFNLATATVQPPDSTPSNAAASTPPELIETRVTSSPWTDRDSQEVKPEGGSSPENTEPWNLPTYIDPLDYSYEETVRTENMDRTVLDAIPDRYSPDMEGQRIFDKMFDVESKKSFIDSQDDTSRCAYDIDGSDCCDKAYHQVVQRRDGSRHHRFAHVAHAAALRHKYAILEHELRLQGSIFSQKSLSEECEDLGVDSPSASELFPEAELLFGNSPAHEAQQHSHTPQPTVLSQCGIPQPDIDDQIATDDFFHREIDDQEDLGVTLGLDEGIVTVSEDGMQATIALDQEEFARSHPNTTFHSEPTEEGEMQPFTITGLKGRHITSTIFHATRAPATVLVSAPPTVISHGEARRDDVVKYDDLNDARELHLTHTASAIVHSTGNARQVIRRVCWDDRRDGRWTGDPEGPMTVDGGRAAGDVAADAALGADDGNSTPERLAELYWESNSASERSESRRPLDFSSDSEKCCKSPYDETNSTDSSMGAHVRLDSVIKDARGIELSGSADGSSADDAHPPIRTYPVKRYSLEERSMTGKTRAGERSPDIMEVRRRASGRGVVKRGCHCCNGSPAPLKPKKSRPRKPGHVDLPTH